MYVVVFVFRPLSRCKVISRVWIAQVSIAVVVLWLTSGWLVCITNQKIEKACLNAVRGRPPPPSGGAYAIRAPKLYYFDAETNTQIHEYLTNPLCLQDYILKHSSSSRVPPVQARPPWFELGRSLGDWLLSFHRWASLPEQVGLREEVKGNEEIRQLKCHLVYDRLVAAADDFSAILRA